MFITVFLNYFALLKGNEKLFGKLFWRHFVVYHAGAHLFRAPILDVIACFLAVFDSSEWPFLCFETDNSSRRIKPLVFNPSSIKTGRFI